MNALTATSLSAAFFIAVPGTVAGAMPVLIVRASSSGSASPIATFLGVTLIALGAAVLMWAFTHFVSEGRATPSPTTPATALVVRGPYRFVRNPMYLAVSLSIFGQSLVHGSAAVAAYGVVVAIIMAVFVRAYEEPTLHGRHGAAYDAYRASVPACRPRRLGQRRQ